MNDKLRLLTPFVMLTAGAVVGIAMFFMRYDLQATLPVLLLALLFFLVLGEVLTRVIVRFVNQNEALIAEMEAMEGDVVELGPEEGDFEGLAEDGMESLEGMEYGQSEALRTMMSGESEVGADAVDFPDEELV
jgi:hypothetical protein